MTPEHIPQTLELILNALSNIPEAKGIDEASLRQICAEAIKEGKAQDRDWLEQRLKTIEAQAAGKNSSSDSEWGDDLTPAEMTPELAQKLILHEQWVDSILNMKIEVAGKRAVFSNTNLRGIDFSKRELQGVKLEGADLRGANLSCTNLATANLMGANLSGANLSGANLSSAKLDRAIVSEANFQGANLKRATFRWVKMEQADLTGTCLEPQKVETAPLPTEQAPADAPESEPKTLRQGATLDPSFRF